MKLELGVLKDLGTAKGGGKVFRSGNNKNPSGTARMANHPLKRN